MYWNNLKNYIKNYCEAVEISTLFVLSDWFVVVWSTNKDEQSCQSFTYNKTPTKELEEKILSNMFFKDIHINVIKLDRDNFEMKSVQFTKPYVHTSFISWSRLLFKTSISIEELKEYGSDRINILHQSLTQRKNVYQLKSRNPVFYNIMNKEEAAKILFEELEYDQDNEQRTREFLPILREWLKFYKLVAAAPTGIKIPTELKDYLAKLDKRIELESYVWSIIFAN